MAHRLWGTRELYFGGCLCTTTFYFETLYVEQAIKYDDKLNVKKCFKFSQNDFDDFDFYVSEIKKIFKIFMFRKSKRFSRF